MESEIEKSERLKARKKAVPGGLPKPQTLVKNWVHQGFLYMDRGEQAFKLLTEVSEFLVIFALFYFAGQNTMSVTYIAVLSFIIVHTFNWVTNNLFWSIVMFAFPGLKNRGMEQTVSYLANMADRLRRNRSITGMALYGSISRKQWHERSDLDVRLLRAPGFLNLVKANLVMMRERLIAFLLRQPTDIFLADGIAFLAKMRSDEKPILLIRRDERLETIYPGNPEQVISAEHLVGAANLKQTGP
ncbi:MAG: hypothetical protein ACE5FQ_12710 [Thiogranum sp.]